ncbi:hypothetical protein ACFWH4_21545 [Streptomyces sp. NPDC127091]|uniref:hypothetical protein n=1 Tax=Streptomyces sp. NPDC127091 TaxID=3347134 RepID=UPI00365D7E3F
MRRATGVSWAASAGSGVSGSCPGAKPDCAAAIVREQLQKHTFGLAMIGGGIRMLPSLRAHAVTERTQRKTCSNKYDVRSVSSHEAGHNFGLKDIHGSHSNLTMFGSSTECSTRARTPGKGDFLGLRSIY